MYFLVSQSRYEVFLVRVILLVICALVIFVHCVVKLVWCVLKVVLFILVVLLFWLRGGCTMLMSVFMLLFLLFV